MRYKLPDEMKRSTKIENLAKVNKQKKLKQERREHINIIRQHLLNRNININEDDISENNT